MNLSGVLVVNKPSGVTSHDVIGRLRKTLDTRRIGHTGTLDPQASGVLLTCVGKATKVAQFLTGCDKEYEAVIKLGVTTDTYDGDGEITGKKDVVNISAEEIRKAIDTLKGKIWQRPPLHSAIKYQGKRLYQYARAGKEVQIQKREVEIKDIEVVDINLPYVSLRIDCSKGTYIRSLAFDLGEKLECGAYLFSLRRTRVGPFKLRQALDLEDISGVVGEDRLQSLFVPIEEALAHLPSVVVEESFAEKVRNGLPLLSPLVMSREAEFDQDQTIAIKDERESIIAIGKALCPSKEFSEPDGKKRLFEYIRVI